MRKMWCCDFRQIKNRKLYIIAFAHLALVCYGILSLVDELLNYQEPLTRSEIIYIGCHYGIHLILISCLLVGAYLHRPYFLVPWIIGSFIVYAVLTFLILSSVNYLKMNNLLMYMLNLALLSLCWYSWYTVYTFFESKRKEAMECTTPFLSRILCVDYMKRFGKNTKNKLLHTMKESIVYLKSVKF